MILLSRRRLRAAVFSLIIVALSSGSALAILRDTPVPLPEPDKLAIYVKNPGAAIELGKALFWDMQVGSDGITACATCHHHAGTDGRTRNTLHPGPNRLFDVPAGANGELLPAHFPFHQMVDRHDRGSGGVVPADDAVIRSYDDAVGAQGVNKTRFLGTTPGQSVEPGKTIRDDNFQIHGRNLRQSTGRNAPTVINSVFNFANFWDGRANNVFNGVNPFGVQDITARIWDNNGGSLVEFNMLEPDNRLTNASLASQAVGPVLDSGEMSWAGRSWPDVGRKMLPLRPLAQQQVHPEDSVLAGRIHASGSGLDTSYTAMVQAAFQDRFWANTNALTPAGFSQIEANFSLFFGLSLMLYQATLVSDDTPFDRFVGWEGQPGNPSALTEEQQRGLSRFNSGQTGCTVCHFGAEFTGATVSAAQGESLIEVMAMGDGNLARYDIGYYNIGVNPTRNDIGRGGNDPFGNPLSWSKQSAVVAGFVPGSLTFPVSEVPQPGCIPELGADPPVICPPDLSAVARFTADGAFKTPSLRNVELTGPYMHNGSMLTLMQAVDFYIRGGNFHEANIADLDLAIHDINGLKGGGPGDSADRERRELVAFLLSLTDERVRLEQGPFDHPQLFIPDGHLNQVPGNPKRVRIFADNLVEIPAVGRFGRTLEGLPPLKPFLADDLEGAALNEFHFNP